MPFSNPERAPELLRSAWIGIDGDDNARAMSRRLAGSLGARTTDIPAGGKNVYHAAAVMSSNSRWCSPRWRAGCWWLSEFLSEAQHAEHSLMDGAVASIANATPEEALTGPVGRGDVETATASECAACSPRSKGVIPAVVACRFGDRRPAGLDSGRIGEIQKLLLLR